MSLAPLLLISVALSGVNFSLGRPYHDNTFGCSLQNSVKRKLVIDTDPGIGAKCNSVVWDSDWEI